MPQDFERPDNKPYLEAVLQYYKTHAVWIYVSEQVVYGEVREKFNKFLSLQ